MNAAGAASVSKVPACRPRTSPMKQAARGCALARSEVSTRVRPRAAEHVANAGAASGTGAPACSTPLGIAFFLLLLPLLLPRPARAIVGDSDGGFGLDGSLRTITAVTGNYDFPLLFGADNSTDGLSQSLLRLTMAGRPADWFGYELHLVGELYFTSLPALASAGPGLLVPGAGLSRYRLFDLEWRPLSEGDVSTRLWLDRAALRFSVGPADITVGRQALTFGKAYFWNPLDVFLAFDPRQFDRDYKPGVDALRVDYALGDFSGLTLVAAAGRTVDATGLAPEGDFADLSWRGAALLLRWFTSLAGWDLAAQAGKVYGGLHFGAGLSGELGPLAVRGEAAWFQSLDDTPAQAEPTARARPSHLQAVLGLGHHFECGLDLQAEFLYNGAGSGGNLLLGMERALGGTGFHAGRVLGGLVASYQILPILTGSLAWIFSFGDYSSLLQPGLQLSVSDEADFLFGVMLGLGARPEATAAGLELNSEFGAWPNVYYLEFKFYF